MGENTMAAMLALSQRLASGPAPSLTPSKAKSVFFDVAGYFMVSTSDCHSILLLLRFFWVRSGFC